MPGLGRLPEFDERSRSYPVRTLLATDAPLRRKVWRRPRAWDQGGTSQCVGFATCGLLFTQPFTSRVRYALRRYVTPSHLYHAAQRLDQWPGEEPTYYGSSVIAGMKSLQAEGLIVEYRWCFGVDDVLRILSHWAPVVIGVNWYRSMFRPDENGLLSVDGPVDGGHAVELHGVDPDREYVIGTNSWGVDWGDRGRFRLRFDDLDRLLREDGEAVTA